jgi:hypothetical protein
MADLVQVLSDMVGNIINAIPAILAAIIVILPLSFYAHACSKIRSD